MRYALALVWLAVSGWAASYPAPVDGEWIVKDFRFHTGEVLPELRLHYTTVGAATGEPVLILHGSNGTGKEFGLRDDLAGQLYGPGQPLDARTHFIILPDSIGSGQSSKPSDGLRGMFPKYTYEDMVQAQYRLVSEHLGLRHLRLIVGNSMGGMHAWMWAEMYPDFIDVVVPMASMPAEVSGRNWMIRKLLIDSVRNDPEWNGGNYSKQPRSFIEGRLFFGLATTGGTIALQSTAPTREKADQEIARRRSQPITEDANDVLFQYDAARDYNPSPGLEKIRARVLAINSADDERNPPELGVMEAAMKRTKNGKYVLLPVGPDSRGHGTTGNARLWKKYLEEFLAER
jgi:homoserine O-acetyltransferase/O-succinyltransferase